MQKDKRDISIQVDIADAKARGLVNAMRHPRKQTDIGLAHDIEVTNHKYCTITTDDRMVCCTNYENITTIYITKGPSLKVIGEMKGIRKNNSIRPLDYPLSMRGEQGRWNIIQNYETHRTKRNPISPPHCQTQTRPGSRRGHRDYYHSPRQRPQRHPRCRH